jgi:hypothetical protein
MAGLKKVPMKRFAIFGVVLLANIFAVLIALSPSLVTYAQVIPDGITCTGCNGADVQSALIRAANAGREQVIGTVQSQSHWLILAALLNTLVIGLLLFVPALASERATRSS